MKTYFFMLDVAPGFWTNVSALSEVDYAGPATGDYLGLVKVDTPTAQAVHTFIEGPFRSAGAIRWESGRLTHYVIQAPRIRTPGAGPWTARGLALRPSSTSPADAIALARSTAGIAGVYGVGVVRTSHPVLAIAWGHDDTTADAVAAKVVVQPGIAESRHMHFLDTDVVVEFVEVEIDVEIDVVIEDAPEAGSATSE